MKVSDSLPRCTGSTKKAKCLLHLYPSQNNKAIATGCCSNGRVQDGKKLPLSIWQARYFRRNDSMGVFYFGSH